MGFLSHVFLDSLSGGVRLFAPVDTGLYRLSISWLELNAATAAVTVTVILGGFLWMKYEFSRGGFDGYRTLGGRG